MSFEVQRSEEPRHGPVVDLHDIQATVLRYRPEPYFGTHLFLHINDRRGGREFLRRLAPHISSASDWWNSKDPWIAIAISYPGLVALGVPEDSLEAIFQPFFRIKRDAEGTDGNGLGLAIAAEAIRLHRGKIHAANLSPAGLEVMIQLPIAIKADPLAYELPQPERSAAR